MKSVLSYHFCEKYGEQSAEYLDINNYTVTKKNYAQINRLVHSMQKAIALPSQYTYISHHANTYGNVPLWVAMNAFTFGQVSKMFQYVTNDVQYKISQKFGHVAGMYVRTENASSHSAYMRQYRILYYIKSYKFLRKTETISMENRTCLQLCLPYDILSVTKILKHSNLI
jgi:hypothetical protein